MNALAGPAAAGTDDRPGSFDLADWLRAKGVTDVDVCGIATDYCVRATALDVERHPEVVQRDGRALDVPAWATVGQTHDRPGRLTVAGSQPQHPGARDQQARAHAGLARAHRAMADLATARKHDQQATVIHAELDIPDTGRAASQFFTLLKGEPHARLVFGCCTLQREDAERHLAASVDLFLRAYAVR